jgi:hypothetical protein
MYPNNNCTDCVPCPDPLYPGTDFSNTLCTSFYDDKCVIYTGSDIPCLNITTGMTVYEIFEIFKTISLACCVTNCQVSDWGAWSACNPATGTKTRTRTIITPPSICAPACPPLTETTTCPVDCIQSEWGPWSACVMTTEFDGTRTRTRTVIQEPKNGGAPCGPSSETEPCCVRPTNLTLQTYLTFQWNDGGPNVDLRPLTVSECCAEFINYHAELTSGSPSISSSVLEAESLTVGKVAYTGGTECTYVADGNYWYDSSSDGYNIPDYTNVSEITIVTIVNKVITAISQCPLLPLSLISSEKTKFDVKLSSSPSTLLVDWGDGTVEGYTVSGLTQTISHIYSPPGYTGVIKLRSSLGNTNIKEFSNFIVGDNTIDSIAFTTAQLGAFTGLTKFLCTDSSVGTITNKVSGNVGLLPAGLLTFVCGGSNETFGTMLSLPRNMTVYENLGFNTTSGLMIDIPRNMTLYRNRGFNTTSGNIQDLPITLLTYNNEGSNTTTGDIGDLKPALRSYDNRGKNTTFGDIGNLPNGIQYFLNWGNGSNTGEISPFQTTTGNLSGLASKTDLYYYSNKGKNTTFGNIENLPASMVTYLNWGLNTTSGDIATLQIALTLYSNRGSNVVGGTLQSIGATALKFFESIGGNNLPGQFISGKLDEIPSTVTYFSLQGIVKNITYNNNPTPGGLPLDPTRVWASENACGVSPVGTGVQFIAINTIDSSFTLDEASQMVVDLANARWSTYPNVTRRITTKHNQASLTLEARNAIIGLAARTTCSGSPFPTTYNTF